ncbi:hypothetical protein [Mycolicibacterium sp. lyk4-40-TYG-92]|uniref:hypothetical protein n=1 Tax=Mycolicibacterium sp. lyk4-40-TYG-92 TaxID=3040295 RepID=UPI00254DD4FC|nr:hypothetical protein [Mycolicibacterium sp. lyk4-40-TYG-92]
MSATSDAAVTLPIAALTTLLAAAVATTFAQAPSAVADYSGDLRSAVAQSRSGASCGPLRAEPLADQTAEIAVHSTGAYLDHNARVVPVSDPLPILKDLGVPAAKAKLLQGAGKSEADAIKSILIAGYKDLRDCSYTAYGSSALPNSNTDSWYLATVVLVET